MKLGFLVWMFEDDEYPTLRPYVPNDAYHYIQIVYCEVEE
jgi:hypothetical protein